MLASRVLNEFWEVKIVNVGLHKMLSGDLIDEFDGSANGVG